MNQAGADFSDNDAISEEEIVDRVFEAVVEQRLPPGTKLSEAALCEAFGVGRMRVRRSLLLLASREVVVLQANRGAFVASPTAEQAREVFEARLMVEPSLARLAAVRATAADIDMLRKHLDLEEEAHARNQRREAIRLSGQFHILVAQVASNSVALRMVKEMVARSSLIIGIYGSPGAPNCRDQDHDDILAAIHDRDCEGAARGMEEHLEHIQSHLRLDHASQTAIDVSSILGKRSAQAQ
jgi:DNA-binding GntR family transcriptional regulator